MKLVTLLPTEPICDQLLSRFGDRSIAKPVSSDELSLQLRSIDEELAPVATRPLGAVGGCGVGVVALPTLEKVDVPLTLAAATR